MRVADGLSGCASSSGSQLTSKVGNRMFLNRFSAIVQTTEFYRFKIV
jgi:hypothetical protein